MDYLEPWFAVNDLRLVDELRREMPPGHVLAGLAVAACARRHDRDEVLFEVLDESGRLAVVHLTHQAESDPRWPTTTLFSTEAEWAASMAAEIMTTTRFDALGYVAGRPRTAGRHWPLLGKLWRLRSACSYTGVLPDGQSLRR